jgi:ABC-type sugar transport system ATPase subunit
MLFGIMRGLAAAAYSIIYISHRMAEIFATIATASPSFRDGQYITT